MATPRGEIDIVALDGEILCFVEVKARSGRTHGSPEDALDPSKVRRFRAAARDVLEARGLAHRAHRFDLVAVDLDEHGMPSEVRIRKDVV